MITVLIRTDGRDELLEKTVESLETNVVGPITRKVIHTDNGTTHRDWLNGRYPEWEIIGGERKGFGGAINRAWLHISKTNKHDMFVFDTEDDFTFNRTIPLVDMVSVLMQHPYIAQMALRRQPWNDAERKAGGIVEMWPDSYEDQSLDTCHWLEHRLHWTTNPSLFHIERCSAGWPMQDHSERIYSEIIFKNEETVSAYWGSRESGEWVTHIGTQRVGHTY